MKTFFSHFTRMMFLAIGAVLATGVARAQVETIMHTFAGGTDGQTPMGPLVQGTDGNFYGTTEKGTPENEGCVFSITPAGVLTILHNFGDGSVTHDGADPEGNLVLGLDGNFYGVTESGGANGDGAFYQITLQGVVTILHSFGDGTVANEGTGPTSGIIQAGDGSFYGTTSNGGSAREGTFYRITPQGVGTILHAFGDGTVTHDGYTPDAGVIQGSDGNFYGTCELGGTGSYGTVFEITPAGVETILHNFTNSNSVVDGIYPQSGVIQGNDGNFYGTTSTNTGTIYEVTPSGTETILRVFQDGSVFNDLGSPMGSLVQAKDGTFYGAAGTGGTGSMGGFFAFTPLGQFVVIHNSADGSVANDGVNPSIGLIQGANGLLYGVTSPFGGVVFSIDPTQIALVSATTASGSVSLPFSYQVVATNTPTTYAATNLPDGLSINSTTGLISGTPTTAQMKTVALTLTNAAGSRNFSLTFTIGALPVPVVTSSLIAYGASGVAFNYATIATNSPTSFAAGGLSGSGLSIDPTTGIISGAPSPSVVGTTLSVSLTATNATGPSAAAALSIQILAAPPTLSQEYNVDHRFGDGTVTNDAVEPLSILQAFDGNFYGVSESGGANGAGAVYKMTPQGTVSLFYSFTTVIGGVRSPNSLLQAASGDFYGTTNNQVFKLTLTGQLTVLHHFSPVNTAVILNGLIQGFDGNFYGTSQNNGTGVQGFLYKITPQGVVAILHNFSDGTVLNDGATPKGALVQGTDGNFYGTTESGGTHDFGIVYKITPQGVYTILHNFFDGSVAHDGAEPLAGLVQGDDGNFYGTTQAGGASASAGTVYQITPQGVVTILHAFQDGTVTNDGQNVQSPLIEGYDGNFYGTTASGGSANDGIIYQITRQGTFTIEHNFNDGSVTNDGILPAIPLIQSANGNFYGVTTRGGLNDNGTIFSINAMQSPVHVPIYIGAAYESSPIFGPLSFTPKAAFGVSGSGVEQGNSVPASTSSEGGIEDALVSTQPQPQKITKNFSATNWTLTGTLPNYLMFDPTSGTISGTPVQGGTFTFTMTPTNAIGQGMAMTVTLYIDVPPGINSATTATVAVATLFSYQIASTPPADSYGATGLPAFLTIDPVSGIISGTPSSAGAYFFKAVAANVSGQTEQPMVLTVTGGTSGAPAITSATTASDSVGSSFSYQIATNPAAASYAALDLPAGLNFDAATGNILGTPTGSGVFDIELAAINGNGSFSSVLALTVTQPQLPSITSALAVTAALNAPFSYQITVTGGATSYSAPNLPPGLMIDSTTGIISGTPTMAGQYAVNLGALNAVGPGIATLNLNVFVPIDFSDWENGFGLTGGPTDTPDHDAVPNLFKYLFHINPVGPIQATDHGALPTLGSTMSGGHEYLTLTYRQYVSETNLVVNVQTSTDLVHWTTVNPPDFSQPAGTDPSTGDPILEVGVLSTGTKQFIRLQVTSPQ